MAATTNMVKSFLEDLPLKVRNSSGMSYLPSNMPGYNGIATVHKLVKA